jgi:RHS repeat-associated protein
MPIMDLATSYSDTGLISDLTCHYRVSAYQGDVKEYYDYYPFGKIMPGRSLVSGEQPATLKYTGKELDDENALEWYYFGARYYDGEIGRFCVVDPLAQNFPGLSPFNYSSPYYNSERK